MDFRSRGIKLSILPRIWLRIKGLRKEKTEPELRCYTRKNLRELSSEEIKRRLDRHLEYFKPSATHDMKANFRYADLAGERLSGANLQCADFSHACLQGANLQRAKLSETNFTGACLNKAIFDDAVFSKGENNLDLAFDGGTEIRPMKGACLEGADLSEAELINAKFVGADLRNADFTEAKLEGVIIKDADISGSSFLGADLHNAKFVRLKGLKLEQFRGADLSSTNLDSNSWSLDLAYIEAGSKKAGKLFIIMLISCCYVLLTLLTSEEGAPAKLPVLNLTIPANYFFFVAPLFLICIYVYFLFIFRELWTVLMFCLPFSPMDRQDIKKFILG